MTDTKPGFLTSEFLLTVLGVVALVVLVLADKIDGDWAAGAIAFACLGYSASRAIVKREAVGGTAQVAEFKADLALLAADTAPASTRTPRKS